MKKFFALLLCCLLLVGCAGRISTPAAVTEKPAAAETTDAPPEEPSATDEPVEDASGDGEPATVESDSGDDEPATVESDSGDDEPAAVDDYDGIRFSLTTLTGDTLDESYIRANRITMVNYWASWCGPCISEIPDLAQLARNYADQGFGIIGVLIWEDDVDGALNFLMDNGIDYPVVEAADIFEEIASAYDAIPTTLFFNAEGEQVGEVLVGSRSYESWESVIIDLLRDAG